MYLIDKEGLEIVVMIKIGRLNELFHKLSDAW